MSVERSICQAFASVMLYDDNQKKWVSSGGSGMSRVHIYQHTVNQTFRVVGRLTADQSVVINCSIVKGLKYNQATPTFHQWRDSRQVYGLNFQSMEDAEGFASAMMKSLELLSAQAPPSQPTQHNFQQQQAAAQAQAEEEARQRALEQQRAQQEQLRQQQEQLRLQQQQEQQRQQRIANEQRHSAEIQAPPQPPAAPPVPSVPQAPPAPPAPAAPSQPHTSPTQPSAAPPPGVPPPPPPPPPPGVGKAPGAPPPPPTGGGGLAAALAGAKLNKVTKEEPSNGSSSNAPSSKRGGGGGGGVDLMSEMQRKLQLRQKKTDGDIKQQSASSGRTSPPNPGHSRTEKKPWETKHSGPPTANRFGSKTNGISNDTQTGSPKLKRRGSTQSNGSLNETDFEKLKQEILADIRVQLNEVKMEIIEAVRTELSKR